MHTAQLRILVAAICMMQFATAVTAKPDGKNPFYFVSDTRPAALDSAKADLVTEGITLQRLVDALGRGWMSPEEGAGIIRWYFSDGRELEVWPKQCQATEVLTFRAHTNSGRMWWTHHAKP